MKWSGLLLKDVCVCVCVCDYDKGSVTARKCSALSTTLVHLSYTVTVLEYIAHSLLPSC